MKKRYQRLAAAALAGMMITGLVSGCGSSATEKSTGEKSTDAASSAQTTEAAADTTAQDTGVQDTAAASESKPASNGGKEVTLWHYFEHEAPILEKMVEEYNSMQSDINIVCTYISREELMKQYTIGAVSGELPDIGMVDSPDMASYISLGVFEDITEQMKDWKDLEQFYPGPLSSCKDADGNIYGIPNNSNCLAIAYNVDMLKAAGFDKAPETWDEFEEVCAKTTNAADGVYGFAMSAIGTEEGTFQFIPWLYSAGADVGSTDSPEAARALDYLAGLVNQGYMSKEVVNWSQSDSYNAFCAGKAAMLESGTWQLAQFDEGIKGAFEYKIALLPKDQKFASVIGGENFGVCAGSEEKEACVEFLKWMTSAQNNASWCEGAGKFPVREDSVALNTTWSDDERFAVFSEEMNYAVARGPHESWPTISEALYTAEQSALLGNKTGEEAMKEAAAVINPILQETPIAAQE